VKCISDLKDDYAFYDAFNTPAGPDGWFIEIDYSYQDANTTNTVYIFYDSTGQVNDVNISATNASDLSTANILFSETIKALNNNPAGIAVDLWELINWLYVTQYWSLLYSVGQTSPVLYSRNGSFPNTFAPYTPGSQNNIFINSTLFDIYSDYLLKTVLPLLSVEYNQSLPFKALSDENYLVPYDTGFTMGYTCTQAQLKEPLSLIVSLLVANYALLAGSFSLFKWIGKLYEKKLHPIDGISSWFDTDYRELV